MKRKSRYYFSPSKAPDARKAYGRFTNYYGQARYPEQAEAIVSLGGDGQLISDARLSIEVETPLFGVNFGTYGYLTNPVGPVKNLATSIASAASIKLNPLRVEAKLLDGGGRRAFAANEVQVCHAKAGNAVHLSLKMDKNVCVSRMGGDGIIVASGMGSTAYNSAAGGPTMPLGNDFMVVTPNNPSRPGFRPMMIRPCPIHVRVFDPEYRTASVWADTQEVARAAKSVRIRLDRRRSFTLLIEDAERLNRMELGIEYPTLCMGEYVQKQGLASCLLS